MEKAKVLVGCPTSMHKAYCLKQYAEAVKKLTYKKYDILLVDNSENDEYLEKIKDEGIKAIKGPYHELARERIIKSRNILRQKTIENYDYLLSLEQDVIPPPNIIEKLLSHEKEITTGIYFANNIMPDGSIALIPLAYKLTDEKTLSMTPLSEGEVFKDQLIKIVSCGLGCVLISKNVLKKIKFRYEKDSPAFDDRWFCIDAYNLKIPIYADTSVRCKHLIKGHQPWKNIKK
ncbi:MAG: glycosyltransferase family A protein [Candidatus Nanoarchaeia archaeon]